MSVKCRGHSPIPESGPDEVKFAVRILEAMPDGTGVVMLDGKMQDHDKQPLTDKGLKVIRTQIERIAADMQSHGIIPGSETALRLF